MFVNEISKRNQTNSDISKSMFGAITQNCEPQW